MGTMAIGMLMLFVGVLLAVLLFNMAVNAIGQYDEINTLEQLSNRDGWQDELMNWKHG